MEADSAESAAERRASLTDAATNLDRALSLLGTEDPQRLHSQFVLGWIKLRLGKVREGEALWQALESRKYLPIYLGLNLARSNLQRESSLEAAQKRFESLAREVADKIKESSETIHQNIDRPPLFSDETTYIEALTYAELGTAAAITRREGGFD